MDVGSPQYAVEILDHAQEFCETDSDRAHLHGSLILALACGGSLGRIVDLNRGGSLTAARPNATDAHDDVELANLEAQWEVDRTIPAVLERALRCLRAEHALPGHRVAPAFGRSSWLTTFQMPSLARDVYRTLGGLTRGTQVPDTDRSTADLIYQTGFGDLAEGAHAGAGSSRRLARPAMSHR